MSSITKNITINGLGIALFVVLTLCLQVPVFENYYLCLGYIVMAVYCYSIGTVNGTIVGTLGVILYCILINGLRGMPGWSIGNIVIGIIIGLTFKVTKKLNKIKTQTIVSIIAIVFGTAIGILIVKSSIECLLYTQPFLLRISNNIYAFIADVFILIISLPICRFLDPKIKKIVNK